MIYRRYPTSAAFALAWSHLHSRTECILDDQKYSDLLDCKLNSYMVSMAIKVIIWKSTTFLSWKEGAESKMLIRVNA